MPFPSSPRGVLIRRESIFLEYAGGALGILVDVEEPLHLVNPRFAQDLRIDFAMRSPIVSKAQAPAIEAAKLDGFLGARLAHVVVVCAAFRNMRFRPPTVEDVQADTRMANMLGFHVPRLSRLQQCVSLCP